MKPTPGILYQIDGKIVCNEREKPLKPGYLTKYGYMLYLRPWLSDCKDVVNVKSIQYRTHKVWYYTHDKGMTEIILPEKVLFVPEGEGVRIVELK